MAGTPKLLGQYLLTNSNSTAMTVGALKRWTISAIHVTNIDSVQRTFTLNHVVSGDSVANKNYIAKAAALPTGDYCEFGGGLVLSAGDTIQGLADANSAIAIAVYGIEESL